MGDAVERHWNELYWVQGHYRCLIDWRREDEVLFVQAIGHRWNSYD